MTAKEYLQGKYEWHKKHWNEHEHVDDEFTASEMEAYHQAKLDLLNIPRVSNNEVAVCNCDKPKYVLNEAMQELQCKCGNRFKLQTDC